MASAGLRVETVDGTAWGVHFVKWEYDSAGNVVETRAYDAQGRRVY